MQDDNIEGYTLDSSLIDESSPLIEEYLTNFSSTTIVLNSPKPNNDKQLNYSFQNEKQETEMTASTLSSPNTLVTASTINNPNQSPQVTSPPPRVPSLRDKLQILIGKKEKSIRATSPTNTHDINNNETSEHGNVSTTQSSNTEANLHEENSGRVVGAPIKMVATPSEVRQMIAAKLEEKKKKEYQRQQEEMSDILSKEQKKMKKDEDFSNNKPQQLLMQQPTTAGTYSPQCNITDDSERVTRSIDDQQSKSIRLQKDESTLLPLTTSSNKNLAEKLPPKSKPLAAKLKKMDEHQEDFNEDFQAYNVDESNIEDEQHEDIHEDEDFHNQLTADISLIEGKKEEHYNSLAVEEEKLDLSDDEQEEKGRAMEDLTMSKLEASITSMDQSLTMSSLATPAKTTSPTRARPNSSMRSSTPSYMNSTMASSSKEVSRTSVDLRASAPDTKMRFGMINYHQRPPSANRSPSPNIQKRRVTPRKERIYNIVPTLNFEDISVTTGLGTISVPNYRLTSLKGLGVKRDLKILYLQNNYLASFNNLETQPNLEVLYVANNCISTFYGFKPQPKLTLISLEGNPITKHPHYRLMSLIVCGSQLKKIDGELVQFKEREFVRQYLSANEKAVEAIRSGWLMDPKPRTCEEFQDIIRGLSLQHFDDREAIRNTQIFKDLVSGALAKTTPAVDLNEFEEKKKLPQRTEEQLSPDMSISTNNGFNSAFLTNYINEIKQLKVQLEKKAEELKEEKQKYKDLKDNCLGIDELNLMDRCEASNIAVSLNSSNEIVESVSVAFAKDSMEISTPEEILRDIPYETVTRTSLLVDEQKLFRVHIRMNNSELLDIITDDKKQSLSIYKILHMKVAHANKQKKLRQQANK